LKWKCLDCNKVFKKKGNENSSPDTHKCGYDTCRNCDKYIDKLNHKCFIQEVELKPISDNIIYFDFEAQQETGEHIVNLACLSYVNDEYDENDDIIISKDGSKAVKFDKLEQFCKWLIRDKHVKGNYKAIAHNGKGYDFQFILRYCVENGIQPFTIYQGSKIMMMSIGKGRNRLTLLDSLNFLTMPLKAFPKTFGLKELKKGYFPHFFNKTIHNDYVGPLPAKKHYGYDQMSKDERDKFISWYEDHRNDTFDMKRDILEYCISDVQILKEGCEAFRRVFIEKENIDPFSQATIASTCMKLFRAKYMDADTIAVLEEVRSPENHSKVSIEWLEWVSATEDVDMKHALTGNEFKIPYWSFELDEEGTDKAKNGQVGNFKRCYYKVDGYAEASNTVYEYHGCFWHGCPKCYENKPNTINKKNKKSMKQLYNETVKRIDYIKKKGYNVVEMWGCDWKNQKAKNKEIREFMVMNEINVIEPLNPRDAMYGGRVNATKLHWTADSTSKYAKYKDITSLYPTVMYYDKYPNRHHTIINRPEIEKLENREYFGIVKCKIVPPKQLYHPVLPTMLNGKLIAPLCFTCAVMSSKNKCNHCDADRAIIGTWATPEIYKALDKGYKIISLYEVHHWENTSDNMFKAYIGRFLKIKQESSGWPSWVVNEDDKQTYIQAYKDNQGIQLDYDKIKKNEGLRAMAKLCLNSLWGKFGQSPYKPQTKFIKTQEELYTLMTNDKIEEVNLNIINEDIIEASYTMKHEHIEDQTNTNVVIALFTTCYARMRLYDALDKLGEQVLYFDTDSVVYSEGKEDLELGDYLGEWTDELDGKKIVKWVSGGPKNYGYVLDDGSIKCKIKGFTLNYENSKVLNLTSMLSVINHGLGLNHVNTLIKNLTDDEKKIADRIRQYGQVNVWNDNKITRNKAKKRLFSEYMEKMYSFTYTKRRVVVRNECLIDSLPYGMNY
jgi:hypothetical protein